MNQDNIVVIDDNNIEELRRVFSVFDGVLIDIRIHQTTRSDWIALLSALEHSPFMIEATWEGQPLDKPISAASLFDGYEHADERPVVRVWLGSASANCFCHDEQVMEFDLCPREMARLEHMRDVASFVKIIGSSTNKVVNLLEECPADYPYCPFAVYDPQTSTLSIDMAQVQ